MKRRREITVETERIVIRGQLGEINWCDACAASTPMVIADQAASLIGEGIDRFNRLIEQGQLHATRTSAGTVMICLKSLSTVPGTEWRTQLTRGPG
jgi:hypothetical protein